MLREVADGETGTCLEQLKYLLQDLLEICLHPNAKVFNVMPVRTESHLLAFQ